ncbi:sucrase ferredoxin [Modestobacter sp. I12A-02628]|uniref:Sucrase ferredoxin n=1 Tax=Goekera deserti TaxID=2497753 RepID=A0A7K3WAS9_9ACTN|nr:sucrase ferredoxin [Goekera deserti]NDI47626.1 sucrase ferredoxin [Goekera deserti]NDI47689.1 sucrase ferredoxin [Goekera deserti]NEL53437.1 sucrase ferredoxin [Goekera deserti]
MPDPGPDRAPRVSSCTSAPAPETLDDFCIPDDGAGPAVSRPVPRLDPERCSVAALTRGDSGVATAPPAQRWLLVEQPGPWGREALLESRFDRAVASRVARRAREEGVRVQLVRRPGARLADTRRRWAYVDTSPGVERAWWSIRSTDAELLDVPWDGSVGTPADRPMYLVCTHGAHDTCCAVRGRPLARDLPAPSPADVWETSHLGGCRFAANIVVLPQGCYYGQVPGDGAEVVAAHEQGRVALPWLRGRTGLPLPVQAAQHHARHELGLTGLADLPLLRLSTLDSPGADVERWAVTLAGPRGAVAVVVESRLPAHPDRLTCAAPGPGRARTWHAMALTTP